MVKGKESSGFRVIIAGGGIAGLTLANALQLANIDYVLLEGRNVIAPQVGASIGIGPSGARILDQIGCYDDINEHAAPVCFASHHYEDGSLIKPPVDTMTLVSTRSNYDICFLDRQYVLEALYKTITDKSKILVEKRIQRIEHSTEGVTAHCTDGTSYEGDIIAGSDGVNSMTRQEMWRAADAAEPGKITEKEKKAMFAEYNVLFGISGSCDGVSESDYDVTYTKGLSTMMIGGKGGKVYWFVFEQMAKVHRTGSIPKYTKADEEAFAEKYRNTNLKPEGAIKFADIWNNRMSSCLVPTEEAEYEHWTWGRFVCLGDSIHKVTPNMGAGGNASIESAAALANAIKKMVDECNSARPSLEAVKNGLQEYEKIRSPPVSHMMVLANSLTRIQALKTFADKITALYIAPNAGDFLADLTADMTVGSIKIDYLPPPERSLDAPMPFNPQLGLTNLESKLKRMLFALPFLGLTVLAVQHIHLDLVKQLRPFTSEILKAGRIEWGSSSMDIRETFYHIKLIDDIWRNITIAFLPAQLFEPITMWQMPTFLADFGVVYAIFLIESARRANTLTLLQLPSVVLLIAQVLYFGVVGPVYCFLHYTLSAISKFQASDMRLTNLLYTRSVLPTLALCYYIPGYMFYRAASPEGRYAWSWFWQMFPVWTPLVQYLFAKTIMPDTMPHDRIHNTSRDLPTIYLTVGTLAALSSTVWVWTIFASGYSLSTLFIPSPETIPTFEGIVRNLLQWDHLTCFAGTSLWILYLFSDLKKAGMVGQSWINLLVMLAVFTLALGPGASLGLGWIWREYILATRRHKGAIVRGKNMEKYMNGASMNGASKQMNGVNGKASKVSNGSAKQ